MTVDYSVHSLDNAIVQGQLSPGPAVPAVGEKSLAADTNSVTIQGPCVVMMTSVGKKRVDFRALADVANLNPGASPLILPSEVQTPYALPKGKWVLKTTAWIA